MASATNLLVRFASGRWMGAKPLSRREARRDRTICLVAGLFAFGCSAVFPGPIISGTARVAAFFLVATGLIATLGIRATDRAGVWPTEEIRWRDWRPVRTWRTTLAFHAWALAIAGAFLAMIIGLGP